MKALRLMLSSAAVLAPLLAASCGCLSSQQVLAKAAQLRAENRARAEPAMLAAAKIRGAVLLSLEPQDVDHRLPCIEGSEEAVSISEQALHNNCLYMESKLPGCQQSASDGRSFRIRMRGETTKLVIPIRQVEGSIYARLARRDNKLLVLLPRLTSRTEVGTVTECECDGMPRERCPSSFGFVVDDVQAGLEIEEAWVPMAEEHLRTTCKAMEL